MTQKSWQREREQWWLSPFPCIGSSLLVRRNDDTVYLLSTAEFAAGTKAEAEAQREARAKMVVFILKSYVFYVVSEGCLMIPSEGVSWRWLRVESRRERLNTYAQLPKASVPLDKCTSNNDGPLDFLGDRNPKGLTSYPSLITRTFI